MTEAIRPCTAGQHSPLAPCSRCQATGCPWDRIGPSPVCPDCQEALVAGEAEPLVQRLEPRPCAVCSSPGVVAFVTFPLHARQGLEVDLCPRHFHALIGRRLDRYAYRALAHQLQGLGLAARHVFLLHEAFYDERGHPLRPVPLP
jgi:hypothetical protein